MQSSDNSDHFGPEKRSISPKQEGLNDLWIFKQEKGDYNKEGDFTSSYGYDKYHKTVVKLNVSIFKGLLKKIVEVAKNTNMSNVRVRRKSCKENYVSLVLYNLSRRKLRGSSDWNG